jgi:hypothetical protein
LRQRSYSEDDDEDPSLLSSEDRPSEKDENIPGLDELTSHDKVLLHSRSISCAGTIAVLVDKDEDSDDMPELDVLDDEDEEWEIAAHIPQPHEEYTHIFEHRPFGLKLGAYGSKAATLCVSKISRADVLVLSGDAVLKIGDLDATELTMKDALAHMNEVPLPVVMTFLRVPGPTKGPASESPLPADPQPIIRREDVLTIESDPPPPPMDHAEEKEVEPPAPSCYCFVLDLESRSGIVCKTCLQPKSAHEEDALDAGRGRRLSIGGKDGASVLAWLDALEGDERKEAELLLLQMQESEKGQKKSSGSELADKLAARRSLHGEGDDVGQVEVKKAWDGTMERELAGAARVHLSPHKNPQGLLSAGSTGGYTMPLTDSDEEEEGEEEDHLALHTANYYLEPEEGEEEGERASGGRGGHKRVDSLGVAVLPPSHHRTRSAEKRDRDHQMERELEVEAAIDIQCCIRQRAAGRKVAEKRALTAILARAAVEREAAEKKRKAERETYEMAHHRRTSTDVRLDAQYDRYEQGDLYRSTDDEFRSSSSRGDFDTGPRTDLGVYTAVFTGEEKLGFSFVQNMRGQFVVHQVFDETQAMEQRLLAGDVILEVDHTQLDETMDKGQVTKLIKSVTAADDRPFEVLLDRRDDVEMEEDAEDDEW